MSLFLAIDEEGGKVTRIGNNRNFTVKKYSNMASIGATKDLQAAVDNHIPFIMISHISAPNVIGDNTPSSLLKVMITDILRNQN